MVNMSKMSCRLGNLLLVQDMVSPSDHHLERIIFFFRPFNMTLILYEVSFGQKSKIASIGAKLQFVIVYTSLLDEQAFISAVFFQ